MVHARSPKVSKSPSPIVSPSPLPRTFYLRPTLTVAKDLLGKLLVRKFHRQLLIGRIVEVEAYLGERDPASHAYRGKTLRNSVMFREGGYLYVYFTYGMHFCCNVVTEREGLGRAVLLRAVEPLQGFETMAANRSADLRTWDHQEGKLPRFVANLTNGPAKLCEAMRIARDENGTDLCGDEIWIGNDPHFRQERIARSRRIGIRSGVEHMWRFYIRGSLFVSTMRRDRSAEGKKQ